MRARHHDGFTTVRTEGAVLPRDLLARIVAGDKDLGGLTPDDYHLSGERLNEATNRSWNRLQGAWAAFRKETDALRPEACADATGAAPGARGANAPLEPGTSPTRERWLLPLFQELGYGRLPTTKAREIDGRAYAISHAWGNVPIHLVGLNVDLDTRAARVAGAAQASPHSLLQEFLNRSDEHLWGFVSNGLRLRILRDNRSLTRQAYVEFDLEAMMNGEAYADFGLLYLLCHQSRVEGERPEDCWLERWSRAAEAQGTRALDQLRKGVEEAISALGAGFLAHSDNAELRRKLQAGELSAHDYYRDLLRLVYRLLFLFVAEDRGLLFDPTAPAGAKGLYTRFYSTARLRRLAERRRGGRHSDLYQGLRLVMRKLGEDAGCPELGLPALGSFLFTEEGPARLGSLDIANRDLLAAVRGLAFTLDKNIRRAIDYRNLGSEELGSVYEALLELHPEVNVPARTFALVSGGGSERKSTGSYYTPTSLIQCLLDSALDPVVAEALRKPDPEQALLDLKVCDPACGSGHFLVAAAHRIAKRLAALRTGDEEPSPEAQREALRAVIGRCLYGVDVNPMAVELCKVSLWMEALEPGKPLSFLEHRILCGNSLLGATPALLADGIPDEAFQAIEGDDKTYVSALRKRNKQERTGQTTLLLGDAPAVTFRTLADAALELAQAPDDSVAALHEKEAWYELLTESPELAHARMAADAWCAAFVWKKHNDAPPPITHDLFLRLTRDPGAAPVEVREEIARLTGQYRFFHWHLAFPDVFRLPNAGAASDSPQAGWDGGFDVVLGNPPWERIKLQEQEFFAAKRPDIAEAANKAARQRMISALAQEDPALYGAFLDARRQAEGESHLVRSSERYPLCGRGDVNTYAIFAETKRMLIAPSGRVGTIVPSGVATDDTTKFFFQDVMESKSLVSLYDFENRQKLFPAVDSRMKFCLLTLAGAGRRTAEQGEAEFAFFARQVEDLRDPERRFTLSAADLALLNPNTRTCPVFRTRRDAEITKAVYRRVPVLVKEGPPEENPWGISFLRMFDMANDSHLFRTREVLEREGWRLEGNVFVRGGESGALERYLPLYEAKMMHHYDHRAADVITSETALVRQGQPARIDSATHRDPTRSPVPRYWVAEREVELRLGDHHGGLLGFTDVTSPTNERTVIAAIVPPYGVGHSMPLIVGTRSAADLLLLEASLNSYALDYVARQKVGGIHLTFFVLSQLPVISPHALQEQHAWTRPLTAASWLIDRALELTYTSWDLKEFAARCGYDGPPFAWDEERRFQLRCEIDAAFFHIYGVGRDDVEYIMETFPIVKRKDEAKWGEYRTKRVVLEEYSKMVVARDAARSLQA